jgi:hypothetical protein
MSRSIFGPTLLCWCLFQEYLQPWKLKNSFSVSACTLIETIGTTRLGTLQAQERQKDCLSPCATLHRGTGKDYCASILLIQWGWMEWTI